MIQKLRFIVLTMNPWLETSCIHWIVTNLDFFSLTDSEQFWSYFLILSFSDEIFVSSQVYNGFSRRVNRWIFTVFWEILLGFHGFAPNLFEISWIRIDSASLWLIGMRTWVFDCYLCFIRRFRTEISRALWIWFCLLISGFESENKSVIFFFFIGSGFGDSFPLLLNFFFLWSYGFSLPATNSVLELQKGGFDDDDSVLNHWESMENSLEFTRILVLRI